MGAIPHVARRAARPISHAWRTQVALVDNTQSRAKSKTRRASGTAAVLIPPAELLDDVVRHRPDARQG